jgi:hypothetical protein
MTNREKLFESALKVFGPNTQFSDAVQNPNCVQTEEDVAKLYDEADKYIEAEFEKVRVRKLQIGIWLHQLHHDFHGGKLKE